MKKIGIITAMKEEADIIINKYGLSLNESFANISFYASESESIVLVLCWIWKIQAWIWTTILVEKYAPDFYINIWIAGNWNLQKINIWDVLLCSSIIQHDMYLPFSWDHLDYANASIDLPTDWFELLNESDFKYIENGICATWDQFIDNAWKVQELNTKYWSDCVEMEAFSVCSSIREMTWRLDNIFVVKAISDWADNAAANQHMSNLDLAMNNSVVILDLIIDKISNN